MWLLDQFGKDAIQEMEKDRELEPETKKDVSSKSYGVAPLLVGFAVFTLAKVVIPDPQVRIVLYAVLVVGVLGWFFLVEEKRKPSVPRKQVKPDVDAHDPAKKS